MSCKELCADWNSSWVISRLKTFSCFPWISRKGWNWEQIWVWDNASILSCLKNWQGVLEFMDGFFQNRNLEFYNFAVWDSCLYCMLGRGGHYPGTVFLLKVHLRRERPFSMLSVNTQFFNGNDKHFEFFMWCSWIRKGIMCVLRLNKGNRFKANVSSQFFSK